MYNRCCLKLCLCIVYSSITSRVKGYSLKVWEDTGWYAWVNAFPPQGLELGLASFAHPFHQWIILLSHYPSALRLSDVWFDTPHQFINAVIHILKSLSSEMSKLQDHIIRNIFFLSFWMRISLALGDSLQSCWLSSTPDILSSHLLSSVKNFWEAQKLAGKNILEVGCENYLSAFIRHFLFDLRLNRRLRNESHFSLSLWFFIQGKKTLLYKNQASAFVSGVFGQPLQSFLFSKLQSMPSLW